METEFEKMEMNEINEINNEGAIEMKEQEEVKIEMIETNNEGEKEMNEKEIVADEKVSNGNSEKQVKKELNKIEHEIRSLVKAIDDTKEKNTIKIAKCLLTIDEANLTKVVSWANEKFGFRKSYVSKLLTGARVLNKLDRNKDGTFDMPESIGAAYDLAIFKDKEKSKGKELDVDAMILILQQIKANGQKVNASTIASAKAPAKSEEAEEQEKVSNGNSDEQEEKEELEIEKPEKSEKSKTGKSDAKYITYLCKKFTSIDPESLLIDDAGKADLLSRIDALIAIANEIKEKLEK